MNAFTLASRYIGIGEFPGGKNHPLIQWWHSLCRLGMEQPDETPWCSSFANGIAWELSLPRSQSAAARSWLEVGRLVTLAEAKAENDVVILERGAAPAGHVFFFGGADETHVWGVGGNQGNKVSLGKFERSRILGIRRLLG